MYLYSGVTVHVKCLECVLAAGVHMESCDCQLYVGYSIMYMYILTHVWRRVLEIDEA